MGGGRMSSGARKLFDCLPGAFAALDETEPRLERDCRVAAGSVALWEGRLLIDLDLIPGPGELVGWLNFLRGQSWYSRDLGRRFAEAVCRVKGWGVPGQASDL